MRSAPFRIVFLVTIFLLPLFASAAQSFSCPLLTKTLSYGSRGTEVTKLQQFLIAQKLLPADSATGFFGKGTQSAIQTYQKKNGIISSGTPVTTGYGAVGKKTRSAMAKCSTLSYSQSSYIPIASTYTQGSYVSGYSQGTYYSEGAYTADYSQSSYTTPYSQGTYYSQAGYYAQGSYYSQASYSPSPERAVMQGAVDMVTWMNATKGQGYMRGFAEIWDNAKNSWISATGGVSQPFKMKADGAASQIYWRKDMPALSELGGPDKEFYGEIYTFDSDAVRLRFESFPFFACPAVGSRCDPDGQAWDIRPDKFRLFDSGSGALDTTPGRFFAPRTAWNGWSHGPYVTDTYYCGSYAEFHQSTCTLYQHGVTDWDSIEAYVNYDIFNADGDRVVATPNGIPAQRIYDVIIVSQELGVTNMAASVPLGTARGTYRERFFYGRLGNNQYGFIRWDGAKNVNGVYILDARTIGYGWDTSYDPTFVEMQARGAENRH